MTGQLKVLERVNIANLTPLMVGKQLLGQVTSLQVEKEKGSSGEEIEFYKGQLADSTGCINFKLVKDKVIPIHVGQTLRFLNFRTKFGHDQSNKNDFKIYLAADKFGNVVEEKSEKVSSLNTKYNVSEEIWEPDNGTVTETK